MADDASDLIAGANAAWGANRQNRVLQGLSGDKDKAAHSIELGNETGLDPESIYGNYDAAIPQMKSMAVQTLTADPLLKSYIDSHALASTVSKDDWGPLSEFSNKLRDSMTLFRPKSDAPTLETPRALSDVRPRELWDAAQRIADAFMSPYAERSGISEEDLLKLHVPPNIARDNMILPWYLSLIDPLQTAVRIDAVLAKGPMALIYGVSQAAGEAKELLFPGAEGEGQRFARHMAEFAQIAPFAMGFGAHEIPRITEAITEAARKRMGKETVAEMKATAQVKEVEGLLRSWAPFVLSGEDPPMGLDPKTDAMKADAAKEVADKMKEVMQAADKSETKQKAPELFQSLAANGTKHEAGVAWKAAAKLYGDKVPEPGDGMLGDIPGIAEKFEKSRIDGSDITIPQADLIARVDKDTVKTLWDNIRWRATDPTEAEGEAAKAIKLPEIEVGEEPVEKGLEDHLTTAAGLDPLATPEGVPLFGETEQRMQKLYNMLMEKIQDRKTTRQLKQLRAIEASRKTEEWKENWSNTRADVAEDIKASPFIRAHDFFQNGIYKGVELAEKPKIDPKYLDAEQRAKIPRRFMKEDGLDPDAIAGEFGYPTGEHFIQELIGFTESRGEIGPKAFIDRMIDTETSRIMEMRYGDLPKDILDRTRSQLLMTERRDQLHLEYQALGKKVGKPAIPRDEIENWARGVFTKSDARKANYPEILRELGRSGRDAQKAFLEGDLPEAFRQKEQQVRLYAQAELVKAFNITQKKLNGAIKRLSKREPEGISQQVRDIAHTILYSVGETPRRSLANVQESLGLQTFKTAKEFQDHWNQQNRPVGYEAYNQLHNPYITIPDFILDKEWDKKTLDEATVGEVRAINNALQSLIKHGEGEQIVRTLTREYNLDDLLDKQMVPLIKAAGKEKPLGPPPRPGTWAAKVSGGQRMAATLMQMDYLWNFLSGFDETGIFNRVLTHEFGRSGNEHRSLQKKYGAIIARLTKYESDFNKPIANNVFKYMERLEDGSLRVHPRNEFMQLTEGHLLGIMLNMGTNFDNLAAGFKVSKEQITNMVSGIATPRHWQLVKGFWNLLKDLQTEEDRTTMKMNGTTVDRLPIGKLDTRNKTIGVIDGGYYPLSYDREMGSIPGANLDKSPVPVIKEQTDTGWHVPRTGYVGPLNLTISDLGQQIDRRLRAIAFNPVLHEMSKVMRDPRFVKAIRDHIGPQYADLIPQYINDIAGQHDFTSRNMTAWDRLFEKIRNRTINYLIGWNPGTWSLHIPTATLQSIGDVGLIPFIKSATYDLWKTDPITGERNWKFIHEGGVIGTHVSTGAKEIQGRTHHFIELPEGQMTRLMEGGRSFEEISGKWGATPIAWTDKIVSTITYMAKYKQVMAENIGKLSVEEAHMLADDVASSTVRRTHGSTLITSKAEILRQGNPVFKNLFSLYNFMNNIHNRQWEMVKAGGKAMRGEAGVDDYKTIAKGAFFYVVVPTAIEEMVNPFCGDKDSNLKCLAKGMAVGASSGIGTARDIVHGVITGHEAGGGVTTAYWKDLNKIASHIGDPKKLKGDFGAIVEDAAMGLALAKGWGSRETARWEKLLTNAITGKEKAARNPEEALRQFRYGTKEIPKGPQVKSRILQLVMGKHR